MQYDYAKEFDKVDHGLLQAKLKKYDGFILQFITWIEYFLTEH